VASDGGNSQKDESWPIANRPQVSNLPHIEKVKIGELMRGEWELGELMMSS